MGLGRSLNKRFCKMGPSLSFENGVIAGFTGPKVMATRAQAAAILNAL